MTSSKIKYVALTAATGVVGSVILEKRLTASGLFNRRTLSYSDSTSSFPPGTDVVKVDFSSVESLTAALNGQDAVVSGAGNEGLLGQKLLVDAAIAAGVKRFLPSEYGGDLANHNSRAISPLQFKVETKDSLETRPLNLPSRASSLISMSIPAPFLDWGLDMGLIMNINDTVPQVWGSGDLLFNGVILDSVGDAVVGILKHAYETANRPVYISNGVVTQNKLIQLVSELGLPRKVSWKPELAQRHDIEEFATKPSKKTRARRGVRLYLHDALPGIKKLSDEELKQYLKEAIIKLSTNPTQKR